MDYLLTNSTFKEVPTQITSYYIRMFLNYHSQLATQYGMELDAYAQAKGYADADAMLAASDAYFEHLAKQDLVFQAIAEQLDITPTGGADRQRQQFLRRHLRRTAQYAERFAAGGAGQGGGKRRAFLTMHLPGSVNDFNALRVALRINSGKIVFLIGPFCEKAGQSATLRHCILEGA